MNFAGCVLVVVLSSAVTWPEVATGEVISTDDLQFLLDEETTLRQKLEGRVQGLHQRASSLRKDIGR